ncbi:hypothetical protein [Niallia sp. 01092]|uniref:hypothetical protein n=1 Tax=unclassified Niallia TaxID=2837522 RepID=UPI003FD1B822
MISILEKSELKNSNIYTLTDKEKDELYALINSINLDLNQIDNYTLNQLERESFKLPEKIIDHLISFKREKNKYGTILFRNLPIDENLPNTPNNGEPSKKKESNVSKLLSYLFMLHLGENLCMY